jgi:hypothetical protein
MIRSLALVLLLAPEADPIDREIGAKANGPLAGRATDAEFLRRASLDLAGVVPTPAETRAFLGEKDPAKREKLVDRLLAGPDYARRMEQAFTVMWLERRSGTLVPDAQWREFLRKSFAANEPWDQVVRNMLLAAGPEARAGMKFMADEGKLDPQRLALDVGRLFLGKNYLCAQCHDHPRISDYKQADFMGLLAYVNQSKVHQDPKTKQAVLVESPATGKVEFTSVFKPEVKGATGPRLPGGKEIDVPKYEKGQEYEKPPEKGGAPGVPKFRPRELLARDLPSAENRQFARNAVNRFWFLLMGRGLVHPLDLDHARNTPSHPELLERLSDEFAAGGFDVKKLLRRIALSESYGRSGLLPAGVSDKKVAPESFRVALPKPLSAEQMAYALMQATGNLERISRAPAGAKFTTKEYLNGKIQTPPSGLADVLRFFTEIFGGASGEPEVEFQPSTTHALFLMNEKLVLQWLVPQEGNLVDRLSKIADSGAAVEELYLSALTRLPDAEERAEGVAYLAGNAPRRTEALGELAWALLASAEFRLNH